MPANVLILGAGFGGIACAVSLRHLLSDSHNVTLVDRKSSFTFGASKTWVALGEKSLKDVVHPLTFLSRNGVEFFPAEIEHIDAANRKVRTNRGDLQADYLVIALGADVNMGAIPGLAESAETYYTLPGAIRLKRVLEEFKGGEVVHLIPRGPFKCPPAPYEGAFLLHEYFRKRSVLVKESLYTVEGAPMATAGPEIGQFVVGELEKRNIKWNPLKRTQRVDAVSKTIHFEEGTAVPFDLLIAVPPHEPPKVVKDSGLSGPSGWIPSDPKTLRHKDHANVFVIGDVAGVSLPGRFKPDAPLALPKAGIFAERQGRVVAANIAAEISGRPTKEEFNGEGFCFIEMGDMHAAKGDGHFYAMPHPTMDRNIPNMQLYQAKKQWIDDWLKEFGLDV